MPLKSIKPIDLYAKQVAGEEVVIIDVRSLPEYEDFHIEGAILQPITEFDPDVTINYLRSLGHKLDNVYVACMTGKRATRACEFLRSAKFENAILIEGGTEAWEEANLPIAYG